MSSARIAELEAVLQQQERKILEQQETIDDQNQRLFQQEGAANAVRQQQLLLQQQLQQQQQRELKQLPQQPPQQQELWFNTTTKDIIDQFRRLKPLDEKHNPRAFINSVEANLSVCGNNTRLIEFCLRIVANEKVLGNAGSRLRELQGDATWEEMKAKILQEFSPKRTFAEIFNECRRIKVSNLRELFNIFEKSKYEINDVYLSDPLRPGIYRPENVYRDLVDILLEKIDGPIRAHLNENASLSEIIMKYTKLKLLEDPRAIAFEHKYNPKKLSNNWQKSKPNSNFPINNRYPKYNFNNNNNFNNRFPNQNTQTQNLNSRYSEPNYSLQYTIDHVIIFQLKICSNETKIETRA